MPPTRRSSGPSGNPARRAAQRAAAETIQPPDHDSKYAPTAWGSGNAGGPEELTLPSGQLCLVRRPGAEALAKAGVLRNVDFLTTTINEKHIKRVENQGKPGPVEVDMDSLLEDEESMAEVTRVVDKVIVYCVIQPQVHTTPDDVTRRQPGVIYADMVDLTDKMFILQFVVGGTRDLESFRIGLHQLLGGVDDGEDVSDATG